MKILEERPLTLAEVKKILEDIEKREELDYRAGKVKAYLEIINPIDYEKAIQLKQELIQLGLREKQACKIVDFMPEDNDDLRVIFYGKITDPELYKKILEIVDKYR